jgi:Leucine-rich repeat (LRR) protein
MEQAWLDSLSEDWPSDPRSASPPPQSLHSLSNSTSSQRPESSSIPRYNPQKQIWVAPQDVDNSALSERSLNENNIPLSQRSLRQPSKLREVTNGLRGRHMSRTISTSTTTSTQCHTVQHKSHSLSPKKCTQETPEWKRRLLQGEVAYGEQRDLFSPAGLENIFRPPTSQTPSPVKGPMFQSRDISVVMPSSPPPYNFNRSMSKSMGTLDENNHDFEGHIQPKSQQPQGIKYKLNEPASSDFTAEDLSRSSTFRPVAAASVTSCISHSRSNAASIPGSSAVKPQEGCDRVISGQSIIRNEGLSPIYINRHDATKLKLGHTPSSLPASELQQRLEHIQKDGPVDLIGINLETSVMASLDSTHETDDFARNGNYINIRRGGYSQEGSFHHRMLSPSSLPAIDESALLPEDSLQASTPKQLPNIRKTRESKDSRKASVSEPLAAEPHTPHTSPRKHNEKDKKSNPTSPLKLFGAYDTFTNQKLLRRLSQFEGASSDQVGNLGSTELSLKGTHPDVNNGFVAPSGPGKLPQRTRHLPHTSIKYQSFGEGHLDSFEFSESYGSSRSEDLEEDDQNISLPHLNPRDHSSLKFCLEPSPALEGNFIPHQHSDYKVVRKETLSIRRGSRPQTRSSSFSELPASQRREDLHTPRKRNGDLEGKRLPKTPLRDPTPKRRRTLHRSDIDFIEDRGEDEELGSLKETHQQMQSVIGRKRKDARHGDDQQAANPTVLAMRQILRPRTPTPSQRSSQLQENDDISGADLDSEAQITLLQQKKLAKIQAELDSTDNLKISAVLSMSQQMQNDSRKGSVTTQDFLDEAKKIMAGIRGKARPQSGLASLEESESENDRNQSIDTGSQDPEAEDSYQESTLERFSRPPSREGGPLTRLPLKQEDPALLDHLRKYQEMSDVDGVVASSIQSMAMAKEALNAARELDRSIEETISRKAGQSMAVTSIESDPPNIRISENPDLLRKRKHSTSSILASEEAFQADFPTHGSHSSAGQSTVHSIPTGSSRGSDSRRVIAPHTVSHLIPEQLAGMIFDREKNIWVKGRNNSGKGENYLLSDESEEDPFGDIPDLSVDETQELQRIKAVAAKQKDDAASAQLQMQPPLGSVNSPEALINLTQSVVEESPFPEVSNFPSTTQNHNPPESNTVSKSWKDAKVATTKSPAHTNGIMRRNTTSIETTEKHFEEVEGEISIHEDRVTTTPQRKRKVTITFSSPLESILQPVGCNNDASFHSDVHDHRESNSDQVESSGNGSLLISKRPGNLPSNSTRLRTALRSTSHQVSVGGHAFSGRPVSRIEERDEESYHEHPGDITQRSVSIVITTPAPARQISSLALATPRPTHEIGTLTLTPMSDFTMHPRDETLGLDVSYVAQNQRYVMGVETKKTLSLSIKSLVEKITEVEPYEPFWGNMKELDLKEKGLANLHKLDEFCGEVEDLDASHNMISQLDGVPRAVRRLRLTHNILSDLTAWGHLLNLQYVDVSNNDLGSLSAFKSLIHMRSLRADNNKIKSLSGIDQLDGLLSLRLRGNSVQNLNFSGSNLRRLTDLDLKDNHISSVEHLEELESLSNLNLVDNHLYEFAVQDSTVLPSLKYLKLSGNNLESIDVSNYPNLRLLYLDQNRLGKVTGLLKTKHLDSLSMREQHTDCTIDQSFLAEVFEVRKLFLSGNLLGSFCPTVNFLNLQYLELANCGLESLPKGLGQLIANTRVLNLNYNALSDLSPLAGIVRLKKLHFAGNRLRFLKETGRALSYLPTLGLVDLRGNPLTVGFYPPILETAMVQHDDAQVEKPSSIEPYTLVEAEQMKVEKYATCLDMRTKMMKRTYEMLVMTSCRRMLILDGLVVDRASIKAKDKVWEELVKIGVFNTKAVDLESLNNRNEDNSRERQVVEEQSQLVQNPVREDRWHAEDSFA